MEVEILYAPKSEWPVSVLRGLGFVYFYRWNRQGRKGERCRVLTSGKMNSCLVEFLDKYKMVTSRNALRKDAGESDHGR